VFEVLGALQSGTFLKERFAASIGFPEANMKFLPVVMARNISSPDVGGDPKGM
jgi:hypothetical protein